jgi:hypothetical protein
MLQCHGSKVEWHEDLLRSQPESNRSTRLQPFFSGAGGGVAFVGVLGEDKPEPPWGGVVSKARAGW